jgi:hypothetical protein
MAQPTQGGGCLSTVALLAGQGLAWFVMLGVVGGLLFAGWWWAQRPRAEVVAPSPPVVVEQVETVDPDGVVVHFYADRWCTRYAEWVEDVPDLSTDGRVNQVRKAVCVGELLRGER